VIAPLESVYFVNEYVGWAVGGGYPHGGTILKTTNGGEIWLIQIDSTDNLYLESAHFIDENTGWAAGSIFIIGKIYAVILRTTDGGTSWNAHLISGTRTFYSIQFIDSNNGWAVGSWGTIITTTDGGKSWINEISPTSYDLYSVDFIDHNTGWAVGNGGTILKTTTGGATFIEEKEIDKIPNDYLLSQNYPNPFNPSTKIRYSVPQPSEVAIKVFDILGSEIETLVNEEKPAGAYELTWNPTDHPSGVYFYQLRAGDFIQTKKMILIK
jgi:photosystem II stability/assembly factor-like uncharacterized protein